MGGWRRDPLVVNVFWGGPALLGESVVGSACGCRFVDIGATGGCPTSRVMDFATVSRYVTAGPRAMRGTDWSHKPWQRAPMQDGWPCWARPIPH